MYTIGIEGLVRAGKSTLSGYLAKKLSARLIHEYGVYSRGSKSFPKYPPQTYSDALDSINYFIGLEALRISDILIEDKLVVVDRTYLTCLAFDYAARHFTGFDIYETARNSWAVANRIEPDIIIFLDVSDNELDIRITPDKHKYLPHFYQPNFNSLMRQFYLLESEKDNRIVQLNANQSIDCVQAKSLQVIMQRTKGGS